MCSYYKHRLRDIRSSAGCAQYRNNFPSMFHVGGICVLDLKPYTSGFVVVCHSQFSAVSCWRDTSSYVYVWL